MKRKIKVWMGFTTLAESEYLKSFELDYETEDFEDPAYKICEFCKHIEQFWYDEDFIGIIPFFERKVDVLELLSETPLNSSTREIVKNDCITLGIESGNAILYYSGDTRPITVGEDFQGLKFIGEYNI